MSKRIRLLFTHFFISNRANASTAEKTSPKIRSFGAGARAADDGGVGSVGRHPTARGGMRLNPMTRTSTMEASGGS